jgi:DNA invertase Pin-like site-specific DNA recombinase
MADQYSPPPPGLYPGARVWAYLRDSGGPSQEQSVDQQEHEIKEFCKCHDLVIIKIFRDVARSGGSTVGRDEFMSMIDMSEDQTIRPHGLLVWNFARFARDYTDAVYYKSTLRKHNIIIHSLTDVIPMDDFAGRIVETVIDLAGEEKRRQTSRDVKRGLRSLVSKGYAPGVPPRGYKAVKVTIGERRDRTPHIVSKWEPDPVLSEYVKIAFQLRAEGKSYQEITKATHGKLYKNLSCWTVFFSNKAYLGYGISGDLQVSDHHEPLVTFEVWETVQQLQKTHTAYGGKGNINHPRRVGNPTILSGFTYCIMCGSMMTHSPGHKARPWKSYICGLKDRRGNSACQSKRVSAKNAEAQIISTIMARVLTLEFLEEIIEETKRQLDSTVEIERQVKAASHTLEDIEIAIQRTLNAIEKTGSQSALDRLKQREAEKITTRIEIERLNMQLTAAQVEITPEALGLILAAWREQITKAQEANNIREVKAWLMQFVSRIELGYNQAKIFYTYPMIDFSRARNALSLCGGTKQMIVF